MSDIKVEISQYRPFNKGALRAWFSMVIQPQGQKILDCRYFVNGSQRWFNFPCKEVKKEDQEKAEYIPYVSYTNKQYLEELKAAVLEALMHKEVHERQNSNTIETPTNKIQTEPSFGFGQSPF